LWVLSYPVLKMTFTTFESYKNKCIECTKDQNLTVKELDYEKHNGIDIQNIKNSDPVLLLELILWAYDSGFNLGGYSAKENNGSIIIYE